MPQKHLTDFGYDRSREPVLPKTKPKLKQGIALSNRSIVSLALLPPVGQQGTPQQPGYPGSCCAWAASYGFATFYAAQNNGVDPSTAEGQASPACIYISVISNHGGPAGQCQGSAYNDYWVLLQQNGTANMDVAPYSPNCATLWKEYASGDCPSDLNFKIPLVSAMDSSDLDDIKTVISNGQVVAFATELYSDWGDYQGSNLPVPYVGNGQKSDAYHCMIIIGYDDALGAFLVQNSQGVVWGTDVSGKSGTGACGYVWIAYDTFLALAESQAYYLQQ